jgi:transcriptional regulator GlxA family with amidase domain
VSNMQRNLGILIFNEVEVLDFCGPFEVFSVTGRKQDPTPFKVYTIAESEGPVLARNGLSVNPAYTIHNCPTPDILVVPGGYGTRREMHNTTLINWIREVFPRTELTLSVCTGALLLAKAGLLDGLKATTHHNAMDELRGVIQPTTEIQPDKRFVDNGKIVLSGGISAGIDAALYVVARLLGNDEARATAEHMEYDLKADSLIQTPASKEEVKYAGVAPSMRDEIKGMGTA